MLQVAQHARVATAVLTHPLALKRLFAKGYVQTAGKSGPNRTSWLFQNSVNSTNHMESELFQF